MEDSSRFPATTPPRLPRFLPLERKTPPPPPREENPDFVALLTDARKAFADASPGSEHHRCLNALLRCVEDHCDDQSANIDYWRRQLAFVTTEQPIPMEMVDGVITKYKEIPNPAFTPGSRLPTTVKARELPSLTTWVAQLSPFVFTADRGLENAYGNAVAALSPTIQRTRTTNGRSLARSVVD